MKKDNSKSAQQMTTVCKDSASEKDNKIEGEEDHVESIPNYSLPNGCTVLSSLFLSSYGKELNMLIMKVTITLEFFGVDLMLYTTES